MLLEASGSHYGTNGTFSNWTSTGSSIKVQANQTGFKQSTTIASTTIAVDNSSSTATTCFAQFVSPALNAQTISGTVSAFSRMSIASATGATCQSRLKITVIDRTGAVVATLLPLTSGSGNLTTTLTSYQMANAASLSSYACADGDRICIEVGIGRSTGTTARNGTISFGSSSGTNISSAGSTTANNPVVTFSNTLVFYQGCNGNVAPGGGGGGTVPTTNLWAYYEADQGVTTSGSDVTQWNDLSGNGRHAVANTVFGFAKPQFSSNTITFNENGFSGQWCDISGTIPANATIYIVFKIQGTASFTNIYAFQDGGSNAYTGYVEYQNGVSQIPMIQSNGGNITYGSSTPVNTYALHRFVMNSSSSSLQRNNGTVTTGNLGTNATMTSFKLGNPSGNGNTASITMQAFYIYAGGTAPDTDLKTYTTSKWGLP